MVDIAHEKDPEILRQVVHLQELENERLRARIRVLIERVAQLSGDPSIVQRELIQLQELLARREQALFGRSSESSRSSEDKTASERKRQVGHGPRAQPKLPVVERLWELDEADKKCPACGGELFEWKDQFEESEEIDVVAPTYVVLKHKRKKYRCKCGGCVETALGPQKLGPQNRYSIDFAIYVAVSKYLDHLPLERQVRMMRRAGLEVTSQVLWDQIELLARLVGKLPQRLLVEHVLKQPCVGVDETHWWMLKGKSREEENRRWWVWSASCEDAVVHRIFDTRSHEAAKALLGEYAGVVLTDGYAAYAKLKKEGGRFIQAHCWAHVRREFLAAEKFYPRESRAVVNLIDALFAVEREVPNTGPPDDPQRLALIKKLREEKSAPIIKALEAWGMEIPRRFLPESAIGKAAAYMAELWPGLVRFLSDPRIPLSNNGTERALRGVVVGRKNHYGSKSKRGTEVAAVFYTIFETAKLCGVDPTVYLRRAVQAALAKQEIPLPHAAARELELAATGPAAPP
jgi:transposase